MEGSHSVSSGSAHQDDLWTCQRCGWVYPNAHPSAKHRRNHKKQCGKIKGLELRSEHKAGSSDDASSDDGSHVKMENLPTQSPETQHAGTKPIEVGSAVPAVEPPSALLSRDLPVNEVNVSKNVKPDTPVLRGISASLDVKPDVPSHESTENGIERDVVISESAAPEHVPSIVSLDRTAKALGEGNLMHATLVDRVEVPALVKPGLVTDEAKESVEQDAKFEDAPVELTREIALETAKRNDKLGHASKADRAEAVVRDSLGVDFDLESSAQKKDARSEGSSHVHTQSIASLDEPSSNLQEQSKVSLTPCVDQVEIGSAADNTQSTASWDEPSRTVQEESKVRLTPYEDKVEIADQVSRGLDSEQARETHKKESSLILKEQVVNRQGSSLEDDSWRCNRCGWVYPNPHPSAKHRRNHKKQCGKIKGFELRTEPHKGGSSDEVSSDEEIHAKKEHLPHQSPQISEPQDQSNNPAAIGSTPPDVDTVKLIAEHLPHQSPQILEAQSQDNNPAATGSTPPDVDHPADFGEGKISTEPGSRDLSASTGDAPDKELSATPNFKDISTPDIKPAALEQVIDGSVASQLPKLSSLKEETLSNPANVQEILGSPETQLNAAPCLPKSVNDSASEGLDDRVKDTLVESGSTNKLAETSDGLLGDCTPNVASIPSVPDSLPSASSPSYAENKGASILNVDEPSLVVISAMDPRAFGLSNETLDASAGAELNQGAILKEGKDVPEKPVLVGLDASSNFKNLDTADATLVQEPLRRETVDTMPAGLEGRDGLVAPDKISSDLSPPTLTADEVHENKSVNLLPPTVSSSADVFGLANDAVQASENPITKAELLPDLVERGNDGAFSTRIDKADEPAHSLEKLAVPIVVAEVDIPNDVITPADKTPEAKPIQERLDMPGYVEWKKIPLQSEDLGQGAAPVSAGINHEITNTESSITKDSYMSDIVKESDAGGTLSVKEDRQVETEAVIGPPEAVEKREAKKDTLCEASSAPEAVEKPEVEEDTPCETRGAPEAVEKREANEDTLCEASGAPEAVEKPEVQEDTPCEARAVGSCQVETEEARGASGVVEKREAKEDTLCEASGAPEVIEKPEVIEDAPWDARGIGSSDLSYSERNSVTRADSLEIYEDAQDSLETCSVGGSVEENESLDEPRQTSDVIPEEPKHLGVAPLDRRVPGERVGLDKESGVMNGSSVGEANSEERASSDKRVAGESVGLDKEVSILNGSSAGEASSEGTTLPEVSYTAVRSEVEDLKAPSPEVLPGFSYTGRSEVQDLKAPSPEAWQEPGPSNFKSEGKKISTSEVTEDGKSAGESHTALRSLMAKEGPEKADQSVETITPAADVKGLNKAGSSLASGNGRKPKSRSFWSHCICCPTVH